jgi:acyl-CoA reductase-like NAD-dependent aldehyde dehydrogenase
MNVPRNLVGGHLVETREVSEEILNPATEESIGRAPLASAKLVEEAIDAAYEAFTTWRYSTPSRRASTLLDLAERIEASGSELALIDTDNVGMPITFSEAIVASTVDVLRFFAGAARSMSGLATGEYVTGMTSFLRREPIGVVGQLLPWNVPLLMAAWKIGPALAAGNTVVVKPSRRTPMSLLRLSELLEEVVPPGVVNVVTGTHDEVAATLAKSPRVRMIALTGSPEAGTAVTTLAATTVKRLHLELGGNTPVIVCADADIEAAAHGIVRGALDNSGQDCTAASRVLAERTIADRLIARMNEIMSQVRVGPPRDKSTEMGPLIGGDRREAILAMVESARAAGAEVVRGGNALPGPGYFMEPTIVHDPEGQTELSRREIFGPVVTVERWGDLEEAVVRANDSPYGLAAGIWTTSLGRALELSGQLEAGKIWINEHHRDATEMPHGGMKRSGYGSDLSTLAVMEYTAAKAVHARFA